MYYGKKNKNLQSGKQEVIKTVFLDHMLTFVQDTKKSMKTAMELKQ